jgi:hypothetical protein
MSMKIFRLSSFLFAIAFVAAAFCFDSRGSAGNAIGQNANSSTTMTENTNAGTTRRRRGRRTTKPAPAAADSAAAEPSESVAPAEKTEQTDLSGTYTGTFDCSDAGLTGETTLTITGNQFTTSDGKSGRITAATTRGYTGVAMQFGELVLATGKQPGVSPIIVSMRAKKSRDRLTLTSVPEATRACSFTPAGAKRAARARRMPPPAPTPAEAAPAAEPATAPVTPAEPATPGAEAGPMPPTSSAPATRRHGRRGRAKPKPAPATPPGN